MKIENLTVKSVLSILIAVLVFFLFLKGYESIFPYEKKADESAAPAETEEQRYVVYEAVFMENEEVLEVFRLLRGETPPYEHVPDKYHVTTVYMPERDSRQFYGSDVAVHGYCYKAGEVMDTDGNPTGNEGVLVVMYSSNSDFQHYFNNIVDRVYHITGSYTKEAKYTLDLDYSDGTPVSFTITGKFGALLSNGTYVFRPEEADAFLNGTD